MFMRILSMFKNEQPKKSISRVPVKASSKPAIVKKKIKQYDSENEEFLYRKRIELKISRDIKFKNSSRNSSVEIPKNQNPPILDLQIRKKFIVEDRKRILKEYTNLYNEVFFRDIGLGGAIKYLMREEYDDRKEDIEYYLLQVIGTRACHLISNMSEAEKHQFNSDVMAFQNFYVKKYHNIIGSQYDNRFNIPFQSEEEILYYIRSHGNTAYVEMMDIYIRGGLFLSKDNLDYDNARISRRILENGWIVWSSYEDDTKGQRELLASVQQSGKDEEKETIKEDIFKRKPKSEPVAIPVVLDSPEKIQNDNFMDLMGEADTSEIEDYEIDPEYANLMSYKPSPKF